MTVSETVKRPMEAPVSRARDLGAQLQVIFPPKLCTTLALEEAPVILGRQPGSEGSALLVDDTVSRRHAEIRWDEATASHLLRDLGSSNGSRVGGERVTTSPVILHDGAVVRLGDVVAVYERGRGAEDGAAVSREAIPGGAAATTRLRAQVAAAAGDPSPVLLIGETGTGKERIAREIHRLSGRRGPLVAVNCAALSPQLVESQLFGHRRGAFTGADRDEPGLFRAAQGGSIFLDEVGELPTEQQAKLLRVLQEGEVLPVGATKPVRVDARVIAATWRDLRALADAGGFRLDLYARMSPWEIRVPALRSRRADLLAWIERIHQHWRRERGLHPDVPRFEANAVERLLLFPWSDNLRGIDRLVHQQSSDAVYDVPPDWAAIPRGPAPALAAPTAAVVIEEGSSDRPKRRSRPSREELVQALAAHDGSVRATAKALGRERRLIYRWMELYGLRSK